MNRSFITKKVIITEIIGYALIIISLIAGIVEIVTAPGEVPINYNFKGEVTRYGSPAFLLIMPIVMFFVDLTVSACLHLLPPSSWNMPVKVKPERAFKVYEDVALMLASLICLFAFFCLGTIFFYMKPNVDMIICVVTTVLVFIDIIFFWVKCVRDNQ